MRTSALATLALVALLAGCANTNKSKSQTETAVAKIRTGAESTPRDKLLLAGITALQKSQYDKATLAFHTSLSANPNDSLMHFMAGLTAHMEAKAGKTDSYPMAEVAYKASLNNEPSNKLASLQLARLYMENRDYNQAQTRYAEALLITPHDIDLLKGLAASSYMSRDLKTALRTIKQVLEISPSDQDALKTASLIYAALGKKDQARGYFESLKPAADERTTLYVESRLQDWERIHTGHRFKQLAQADAGDAAAQMAPSAREPINKNMAFVDLIILRTEETGIQQSGKNIMKQLFAQIDHGWAKNQLKIRDINAASPNGLVATGLRTTTPTIGTDVGFGTGQTVASIAGTSAPLPSYILNTTGHTVMKSFGLQAFNYALQIANTVNKSAEVIARPTLVALDGKQSSFFSGNQLVVGLAGNFGGGQLDRERVGVHLEFVPKFLRDGSIEFQVSVGRSFPEANLAEGLTSLPNFNGDSPFGATFQMAVGELTANVVMDFGQTLILAGLSERETIKSKEGFPFLKDIPVLQYFFAESKNIDYHKHLVVMMTPRKPGFRARGECKRDRNGYPIDPRKCPDDPTDFTPGRMDLDRYLKAYAGDVPMEPNLKHVFAGLESNAFYKEFRTGDVDADRWFHTKDREYLINQTIDMLYF